MEPCGTPPPAVNIRYCKRLQPQDIARFTALEHLLSELQRGRLTLRKESSSSRPSPSTLQGIKGGEFRVGGGRDDGGQEGNRWLPG